MLPKWQFAGIVILTLLSVAVGICASPDNYAYAFLSGRCNREPDARVCHPASIRGAFAGGVRLHP
jgi:hypothetical protein